jgi:hypothetical protein
MANLESSNDIETVRPADKHLLGARWVGGSSRKIVRISAVRQFFLVIELISAAPDTRS